VRIIGLVFALCLASAGGLLAADEAPKVAGTDVPVPKRIKFVSPEYPAEAQARGLRGIVILDVIIDTKGQVSGVEVTRSVPPFDDAAVAAVKQWQYEVTKVSGKPVTVRLTVPITFALKMPEMKRENGIPELRQGASPGVPASDKPGTHAVTADLVIAGDGQIAEGGILEGETPWAEALLMAVRTWRFAPTADGEALRFKLKAEFVPAEGADRPARVALELSDPKHLPSAELPNPAAAPGPPQPADATAATAPPVATASPAPTPAPAPIPAPPTAQAPTAPPAAAPSPAPTPRAPDVELISAPPQPPPPAGPEGLGVSAVRDVRVEPGLPDLVRGRRPVVPPLARIDQVEGTVEVKFAVDSSGGTSNVEAAGPELLRTGAVQAVQSWAFRRTRADRLYLVASFTFAGDQATATVKPAPAATP
jgi:TonB family protein